MNEPFSFQPYPMNQLQQGPVRFRGVNGIGVATIVLIILVVAGSALLVVSERVEDTGLDASSVADGQFGVAVLVMFGYLLAGIVFWIWQWRARSNAEALGGPGSQSLSRGWTFWGWWCPVVSLWFPAQVLADIYRASSRRRHAALVICWWPPMLASLILFGLWPRRPGDVAINGVLLIVALVCQAIAAVLAVTIIVKINRRQRQSLLRNGPYGPSPVSW